MYNVYFFLISLRKVCIFIFIYKDSIFIRIEIFSSTENLQNYYHLSKIHRHFSPDIMLQLIIAIMVQFCY